MAAEPSATTSVGSLLNGTYLLERVIAEGGMGVVYEAQHLRLPRKVAVKVLGKPKDATLAGTALQRFRREAEIAATLQHPHIVETFDFQVSDGGSPYLVMELLEGEDLNDRLKRAGRLPIVAALRVIEEAAQALDHAHAKGVVHRDLKPANIFLTQRGGRDDLVKVLDFGVSKLIDAATLTQEKAMVGTPLYMSPEQAVGTQELTPESDVFSLGAIAFEILTGRRAFAASSIPSILYQIVHGPTPTLSGRAPGLNVQVDEVFAKVLAKKKAQRFTRSTEFATALKRALDRDHGSIDTRDPNEWAAQVVAEMPDLSGSGLLRASETGAAGVTEVDSSTKAEEAMPSPERTHPPTPAALLEIEVPPDGKTGNLLKTSRRSFWTVLGLLAFAAAGIAGAVIANAPRPEKIPSAEAEAASAETPKRQVLPATRTVPHETQPQPTMELNPDPIDRHPDVQFVFHVVPKTAQITVDDKRVVGGKMTLPWQKGIHRVRVSAPNHKSMAFDASSSTNQTFELHMERVSQKTAKKPPPPVRTHDAAPVQDL